VGNFARLIEVLAVFNQNGHGIVARYLLDQLCSLATVKLSLSAPQFRFLASIGRLNEHFLDDAGLAISCLRIDLASTARSVDDRAVLVATKHSFYLSNTLRRSTEEGRWLQLLQQSLSLYGIWHEKTLEALAVTAYNHPRTIHKPEMQHFITYLSTTAYITMSEAGIWVDHHHLTFLSVDWLAELYFRLGKFKASRQLWEMLLKLERF